MPASSKRNRMQTFTCLKDPAERRLALERPLKSTQEVQLARTEPPSQDLTGPSRPARARPLTTRRDRSATSSGYMARHGHMSSVKNWWES
eukprot:925235-Prorocentrum_minimum.AAC.2